MTNSKTILITGSNRGIGLELVKESLAKNFSVAGTFRNKNNAKELLKLKSNNLKLFEMDVVKENSILNVSNNIDYKIFPENKFPRYIIIDNNNTKESINILFNSFNKNKDSNKLLLGLCKILGDDSFEEEDCSLDIIFRKRANFAYYVVNQTDQFSYQINSRDFTTGIIFV